MAPHRHRCLFESSSEVSTSCLHFAFAGGHTPYTSPLESVVSVLSEYPKFPHHTNYRVTLDISASRFASSIASGKQFLPLLQFVLEICDCGIIRSHTSRHSNTRKICESDGGVGEVCFESLNWKARAGTTRNARAPSGAVLFNFTPPHFDIFSLQCTC